jgi:hypothetical protein
MSVPDDDLKLTGIGDQILDDSTHFLRIPDNKRWHVLNLKAEFQLSSLRFSTIHRRCLLYSAMEIERFIEGCFVSTFEAS